ncbi:MAG TPA: NADH-quinone oxidoreductase subunit M [Crocinitomicaceae bacterium]|nr:NADH-quinone oxidoreductase subunit M [Crocinitomicaceae bacterium]
MELLILPLVFSLVSLVIPKNARKLVALLGALTSIVFAVVHWANFQPDSFMELYANDGNLFKMSFRIGYDGLSLAMVLLTNIVTFLILLGNYENPTASNRLFNSMVFLMQFALLGSFLSFDLILFYIFWEMALIPVFLLAYWFGEKDRKKVLITFFLYTFIGSLAMLFSIFYIGSLSSSYDHEVLVSIEMDVKTAWIVAFGFLVAFGVKMPLFPFHTWQAPTYTKSPMAGTMLLSALMLKMALYGVLRWLLPLTPEAYHCYKYLVIILGAIGVVYGAIIAIKQDDLKKVFAYASLSHVGLIAAGLMIVSIDAFSGVVIQMVNHALVAVGLFLVADVIERRLGRRNISELGGIAVRAPKFAFWFTVIGFASISIPFSSGFIGEFLLIKEILLDNIWLGILVGTNLVFGCVYVFRAYQLSMNGKKSSFEFNDLTLSEIITFAVLALIIVVLGVYPQLLFDLVKPSLDTIVSIIKDSSI